MNTFSLDAIYYNLLSRLLRDEAKNLLLITAEKEEAIAAKESGLQVIIIARKDNELFKEKEINEIKIVNALDEIHFIEDPNNPDLCC